jgi:uncharacterized protein (DUF1330 family)
MKEPVPHVAASPDILIVFDDLTSDVKSPLHWILDERTWQCKVAHRLEPFGSEAMTMTGHIDPTKETFAQFRENDRPGPIHMLNLVRLRDRAAYPDGRAVTGAEAYAAYGRESGPVFTRLGGRIVWMGGFELMLIGPSDERWDHCFIAEYPSVAAFVEMIRDPVYREAVKHRQAAVEDSRLIRMKPLTPGKTFGEIPGR